MAVDSLVETTQFLSFKLDEELFALDIGKVREALELTSISYVPQTPRYLRGVCNLRGSVVPVLDMRVKFGMAMSETTLHACIIIVEVELDAEQVVTGAMADALQELLDLEPGQIEPAPRIGTKMNSDFIKGMGKLNDQAIIILDIDRVFSTDDLTTLSGVADEAC